ncbi:MAG: BREX-3 system phosphatase PglZ [Thermoguttaceae bacterium]
MSSWRDQILREFTPNVARLTLVADPDGLLLEEGMLEGIRQRGFELIPFDDAIAFRYAYESKFRSRWDQGEQADLVVVLRCELNDLGSLPYDLLQAGRKLSFNLGDIFPNLSYPVVTALDRGDLDALYEAQNRHAPGQLGDNATKEFLLRHVFEIAPELIKEPSDLLRALLRRHYRGQRIPAVLDARFIQLLRQSPAFDDWPLEALASDREAFLGFLHERWPIFLDGLLAGGESSSHKGPPACGLSIAGPADLPFGHPDIRVYMDNLFLEGLLRPVPHEHAATLAKSWVNIGIRTNPAEDQSRRLARLMDGLSKSIPAGEAKHTDWFHFARGWAEMVVLSNEQDALSCEGTVQSVKCLQVRVDVAFAAWLSKRYAGLVNLPPAPPVMLHHVPRFLARQMDDCRAKIALILMDGLSLDQWLVVREVLSAQQPRYVFREYSVFAWIPSVTAVSRQAAFAGKPPIFFPNSIQTNDREQALWRQFWADHGLLPNEVLYARGLGDGSIENISEAISHPKVRIAGLIIDKIDKIMHGMELGNAGMHSQVRQWTKLPYFRTMIDLLLTRGFRIYLTSDHGNVEATGCGRPAEGAIADLRGERVRIYPDEILRSKVKQMFPTALEWEPVGLPEGYLPLIASGRQAFVGKGDCIVSHGGISVEEIIVPFVEIERRAT